MKNEMVSQAAENDGNRLTIASDRRARANRPQPRQRFKIIPFTNRGGSESWRVAGITRTGERIRENYNDANSARCRQTELEAEYLSRASESTTLRSTHLSEAQTRLAEAVFPLLDRDDDLLVAVQYWRQHGSKQMTENTLRLDEAVTEFLKWLDTTDDLRDATKAKRCGTASASLATLFPISAFPKLGRMLSNGF